MAKPNTARPGRLIVSIAPDPDFPETFVAPCGFTSKAFNRTRSLNSVPIPDCDDPDAPFWESRDVQSLSATITGQGVLASESLPLWEAALAQIESVPTQVEITFTDGAVATYTGLMQIESFGIAAEQGNRCTVDVSMQSDGELAADFTPGT